MNRKLAIPGRRDMVLPPDAVEVLGYDPRRLARPPKGIISSWRSRTNKAHAIIGAGFSSTIGVFGGMMAALPVMIATGAGHLDPTTGMTLEIVAWTSIGILTASSFFKSDSRLEYRVALRDMRSRIVELASTCSKDERMEAMLAARALATSQGDPDAETMAKLDMVAHVLKDAVDAAGPDARAAAEARDLAERTVVAIMSETFVRANDGGVRETQAKLEQICSSLTGGYATNPAAPTARLARVLSIAERALSRHPDMTDAAGARVDRLVRTHVPRLVALRAEALESARAQDIDAVELSFEAAFDGVAASVDEAISSIHDEAMQRLSTEIRFLASRRGETRLLGAA